MLWVAVIGQDGKPLMPITPRRAKKLVASRRATPFWKKGLWCVRLNFTPSTTNLQPIVVGIDPGSKREGFTVKSAEHTYLNLHIHAITWVKYKMETRRNYRRSRRTRKCPNRKCRPNRAILSRANRLPPSTRARWTLKLRILDWLSTIFPISYVVVEDVKARTKEGEDQKKWNRSFSPLQQGKTFFYSEIQKRFPLATFSGKETSEFRNELGLKKTKSKLAESFDAHCVDSWVLANKVSGGHATPDNTSILVLKPRKFHRRNLHDANTAKGDKRNRAGGMAVLGFKTSQIVKHQKFGLARIGGGVNRDRGRLRLNSVNDSKKKFTEAAKPEDCKVITSSPWVIA